MQIQRKLQIAAAVVIVNALAALGTMTPGEARADACFYAGCFTSCFTLQACAIAQPGCTPTSVICHNIGGVGCPLNKPYYVSCVYN